MFKWLKKLLGKKKKKEETVLEPIPWDDKDIYGIRFRPIPVEMQKGRKRK